MKTRGLFEGRAWPESLEAHVVDPREPRRMHGYCVEGDLAPRGTLADLVLLGSTGELPGPRHRSLLELALWMWSPISAGEGPAHAGILSRLCGASDDAVLATVLLGLTQEAAFALRAAEDLLAWLAGPRETPPPVAWRLATERDARVRAAVDRALAARGLGENLPALSADGCVIYLLFESGVRDRRGLATCWILSRFSAGAAEAFAVVPRSFASYPADLPPIEYEEGDEP